MAKKLNRIIRRSTPAETRRHKEIREKTDAEFASRRKAVSATRAILAKLRSQRELKGPLFGVRRFIAAFLALFATTKPR